MKFQLMRSPDACENYCTRFRVEIPSDMLHVRTCPTTSLGLARRKGSSSSLRSGSTSGRPQRHK